MGFFRYWYAVVTMALKHSLTPAQDGIYLFVICVALAAVLLPGSKMPLSDGQVALLAFGIVVLIRFALSPYWIHSEQRQANETLKKRNTALSKRKLHKEDRQRIAARLSALMKAGRDLMAQYSKGQAPDKETDQWLLDTNAAILDELGQVKVDLFNTPDGSAPVKELDNVANNRTWNGLRFRVANLRRIVAEVENEAS